MLNLLPLDNKKEIQKIYQIRRFIIWSVFGILAVIISLIFLLPTYLMAKIKYDDLNKKESVLSSELNLQKNQETNFTEDQKQMLNVLEKGTNNLESPISLIDAVLAAKDQNISITDFLATNEGPTSKLSIHGKALTREDLIKFKQTLEANKLWQSVDLPIDNLGPAKNNEFSIVLTLPK